MNKNIKILNIFLLILMPFVLYGCATNVSSISTEYIEKTLYVGDKMQLKATVTGVIGAKIEWEIDDANIASIDNGLVVALSPGKTTIRAKTEDLESVIILNVLNRDPISNTFINITGNQSVVVGESIELKAQVVPNTLSQNVIWSSNDEKIATVSDKGKVTGLKPGVVTITCKSVENNKIYKEYIVLVRTGSGIQDVIRNYIDKHYSVVDENFDITQINTKVVNMVKKVEKSVIGVMNYVNDKEYGIGSAGIFKKEVVEGGYKYTCFTNHHVVENASKLQVYLGDIDKYVDCELVKSDSNLDLAIISFVHTNIYEPLSFASIDSVKSGEFVVAIGNPQSFIFYGSATFGIVSHPNRTLENEAATFIQHDAPINPGNSGGPLFNLDGQVIGINTLKYSSVSIEGMGFSIELSTIIDYIS